MTGSRDKLAGVVALAVSGVAAYGFLALAARALGPAEFAPLGALWATVFLASASIATPLETEVARRVGAARGRSEPYGSEVRSGLTLAGLIGLVAVGGAIAFGSQIDARFFASEAGMTIAGSIAFAGLLIGAAVRGAYAGAGRLSRWGTYLLADGGSRFVVALVAAIVLPSAGAFALALAVGPWLAVALAAAPAMAIARGQGGHVLPGMRSLARSSATLAVGASAASLLTYFGAVLLTGLDRGPDSSVGSYIAALTLARMPLFLLSPAIAVGLPRIAFSVAHGAHRAASRDGLVLVGAAIVMGFGVVVGGVLAGTGVLGLLFGHEFSVSPDSLLALSSASALWVVATTAVATAVAAGRPALAAGAWCAGAIAALVVAMASDAAPFARTDIAIVAGAFVAAAAALAAAIFALASARDARGTEPADAARAAGPATRMRVRYVYDARYPEMNGGAERRYHEVATRLAATCDVDYVSWTFGGDRVQHAAGVTYRGVGPAPEFYGTDGKRRVREAIAFAWRLVPELLRHRADVLDVAATPTIPLYAAWFAATITRTPLVVTWHEFWGEHWHTYLPGKRAVASIARVLEGGSRRLGDRLVCVSPFTAERLGVGHWTRKVTVVANGAAVEEIAASAPATEAIDIVYLGRLIDEKRVELLLAAVARLAPDRPTLRCVVIGDGPERERLEAMAATLGITVNVRFAGRLPTGEVNAALRASTILVLPSAREGYGIVVVEAQAGGAIPIVTTGPATAAPSLLRDGVDGLVVDATPEAIATAVAGLIDAPERRARMRVAAADAARAASWDVVATEMLAVYRSVARRAATATVAPAAPGPVAAAGIAAPRATGQPS